MQQTTEIDLREFGKALLKRLWLIALCAALAGAMLLVYTVNFVTPMYSATVSFYVNNNTQSGSGGVASTDLAVALRLANSYVDLVKRNTVLEEVIEQGQLDMTPKQIRSMLTAKTGEETEIFEVTITTPNPQMSADVANAIALYAPDAIHEIIEGSFAKVIDYAEVPMTQSSPNYLINTLLGGAVGAVLAIVFIFIQMRMDVRIKGEDDLQKICPVPVLGVVPELADAAQTVKKVRR